MVLASDLQTLGNALDALANTRVGNRADLKQWYSEAEKIRQSIISDRELSNLMPHSLWHFLSDADIRFKDSRYTDLHKDRIDEIIVSLKRGQVPPPD